jgi:hypothetical protein
VRGSSDNDHVPVVVATVRQVGLDHQQVKVVDLVLDTLG